MVAGAAWSVPVIALAAAAPASAASQFVCPPVPANASWVASSTGTGSGNTQGNQGASWAGTGATRNFTFQRDNASTASNYVLRLTAPLSVVTGRTYQIRYAIQTQRGCNGSTTTVNTNFDGYIAGQRVGGRSTKSGFGNQLQDPPACNAGYTAAQTISLNYTATSTGTVQLEMRFTAFPTTGGNNDDYRITPSIVCL